MTASETMDPQKKICHEWSLSRCTALRWNMQVVTTICQRAIQPRIMPTCGKILRTRRWSMVPRTATHSPTCIKNVISSISFVVIAFACCMDRLYAGTQIHKYNFFVSP